MQEKFHHIHFVGIKGVGMSALALVAKGLGFTISGSDVAEEFITDRSLREAGIEIAENFDASHVTAEVDLVVVGTAFGATNPEVQQAKARNLPVWTYSELLGYLSKQQKTIAIAGTHGKTTTTSLLAYLFVGADAKPSYVIGTGSVKGLPAHGAAGDGTYFITEADDYKRAADDPMPKFLDLAPHVAVITSIEHDHPDLYPTLEDCFVAFRKFVVKVDPQGLLVVNVDDAGVRQLLEDIRAPKVVSYGEAESADYRIVLVNSSSTGPVSFSLRTVDRQFGPFELQLRGSHNLHNAAAAVTVALELGLHEAIIQRVLPSFETVERRYEHVGRAGDRDVYDDYAHHPTAVALTLETLRIQYRRRPLWCVFQPHTYSRTRALLAEFGSAFASADHVIITDIYGSAREKEATVTPEAVVAEIAKHHRSVEYMPYSELVDRLQRELPEDAVLVTMGAGDIYKVGKQLLKKGE